MVSVITVYKHLVYRTYQVHVHVSICEVLLQSHSYMVPLYTRAYLLVVAKLDLIGFAECVLIVRRELYYLR